MKGLCEKLEHGQVAIGTHISLYDSAITELIGNLGFDYLWIDTEHTSLDLQCLQHHLIAAKATGTEAIVRVPLVDSCWVKPILEMGPAGVVFPQVNSYELARKAVASCFYPPRGVRGYGPRRAVGYGAIQLDDYLKNYNSTMKVFLQVENIQAVKELDDILTVDGLSGLIIGPCDLAASMGHLGDVYHPDVQKACRTTIAKAKAAGIPTGVSFGACSRDTLEYWKDMGVQMISIGADTDWLLLGATRQKEELTDVFGE